MKSLSKIMKKGPITCKGVDVGHMKVVI